MTAERTAMFRHLVETEGESALSEVCSQILAASVRRPIEPADHAVRRYYDLIVPRRDQVSVGSRMWLTDRADELGDGDLSGVVVAVGKRTVRLHLDVTGRVRSIPRKFLTLDDPIERRSLEAEPQTVS